MDLTIRLLKINESINDIKSNGYDSKIETLDENIFRNMIQGVASRFLGMGGGRGVVKGPRTSLVAQNAAQNAAQDVASRYGNMISGGLGTVDTPIRAGGLPQNPSLATNPFGGTIGVSRRRGGAAAPASSLNIGDFSQNPSRMTLLSTNTNVTIPGKRLTSTENLSRTGSSRLPPPVPPAAPPLPPPPPRTGAASLPPVPPAAPPLPPPPPRTGAASLPPVPPAAGGGSSPPVPPAAGGGSSPPVPPAAGGGSSIGGMVGSAANRIRSGVSNFVRDFRTAYNQGGGGPPAQPPTAAGGGQPTPPSSGETQSQAGTTPNQKAGTVLGAWRQFSKDHPAVASGLKAGALGFVTGGLPLAAVLGVGYGAYKHFSAKAAGAGTNQQAGQTPPQSAETTGSGSVTPPSSPTERQRRMRRTVMANIGRSQAARAASRFNPNPTAGTQGNLFASYTPDLSDRILMINESMHRLNEAGFLAGLAPLAARVVAGAGGMFTRAGGAGGLMRNVGGMLGIGGGGSAPSAPGSGTPAPVDTSGMSPQDKLATAQLDRMNRQDQANAAIQQEKRKQAFVQGLRGKIGPEFGAAGVGAAGGDEAGNYEMQKMYSGQRPIS